MGQNRKSRPCGGMSASPPKADTALTLGQVRDVPSGDIALRVDAKGKQQNNR
jgi:hypothetical protein